MLKYKIESGVPIPNYMNDYCNLLNKMKVGDSIIITDSEYWQFHLASKVQKVKITTRRINGNKRRLWKACLITNKGVCNAKRN